MMDLLIRFALWLYSHLLRLYPRRFREEFAEEMTAVFRQQMHAAAGSGWRDVLGVLGRELRDWPLSCLREHLWQRNRRLLLPEQHRLSGWGAVAAALPFFFYFFTFFSPLWSRNLLLGFLFAGLLAAWWQRWPGWVVSWLGFLIFFGQNWLPYSLFGDEPAWNSWLRLLNILSSVAIQTGWLVVMYGVVRRRPRHGALVFLPFLWTSWAFSMEFASEAMTAVIFSAAFLVLAVTAAAISRQRSASGDIWFLYGGTLLSGGMLSLGAVFFSPGMENAWRRFGPELLQALAPFVAILLLQSLNAWSRENGRPTRQCTRWMTGGSLLAFMALLALGRLLGPSDLEAFQLGLAPLLTAVWLVGVLLVVSNGWRLRSHVAGLGKGSLGVATGMLVLLPLLYHPAFLFDTVNSWTYQRPSLSSLRQLTPALRTADTVVALIGFGGLLFLPGVIGRLRLATAGFPASTGSSGLITWWRRRRERQASEQRPGTSWSRRKRLVLPLALIVLLGIGFFFGVVFLPLQLEAEPYTQEVALGDLDGDGDLDAVLANTRRLLPTADNKLLFNDGHGRFRPSQHAIGTGSTGVVLLDSDGDGDLDLLLGGMGGGHEYSNNGHGRFSPSVLRALRLPESGASAYHFGAGDLNGDGITDAFVAGCCGTGISRPPGEMEWVAPVNRVLLGGDAGLADSGQQLGARGSQAIALGDVDGDGDLDAFVGNTRGSEEGVGDNEPNEVWLNDGSGRFHDSGQLLGRQRTVAVALGDVDGDGDLDALAGNEGADALWLNGGDGRFHQSLQSWSNRHTLTVSLIDMDGDGDLDAVTGHRWTAGFAWWRQGLIWWNEGDGRFVRGETRIRYRPNAALAVGDVNGDGMLDILCGTLDEVTVWFNQGDGRFQRASS